MEFLFIAAELLLLVLLPWPMWRLAVFEANKELQALSKAKNPYFNFLIRGRARKILFILFSYVVFLLLFASIAPILLTVLTVMGGFVALSYWFLSRASFGKKSGLPPGTLSFFPVAAAKSEDFYLKKSQRYGPIFKIGTPPDHRYLSMRPMVCITDLKLGRDFLRQNDNALRLEPIAPFSMQFESGLLRYMSDKDHQHYRKLFHTAYSNLDTIQISNICTAQAKDIIHEMMESVRASSIEAVDPRPYFDRMMYRILAHILFGITTNSAEFSKLKVLSEKLNLLGIKHSTKKVDFQPKLDEIIDFLQDVWKAQINRAQDGHPSFKSVFMLLAEISPDAVSDQNVICNLLNDFWSGRIDTSGLLTWTIKFLSECPNWRELYLTASENSDPLAPADNIVKEVLRLSQSEWLLRRTTSSINFEGFHIPKDWNIRICIREAHRDGNIFQCPSSFNPTRFEEGTITPSVYSPFGVHKHKCVGWRISHTAVKALIHNLSEEYDFTKTDDGPLLHLWLHWAPSRDLKIKMAKKQF